MSAEFESLEKRMTSLEATVAELQRQLAARSTTPNWIEQITGIVTDQEVFEEMMRYGREYRQTTYPEECPVEEDLIEHEEEYLAHLREQGVGDNDQVASSLNSYVSYLRSVARHLDLRICPEILHSDDDIDRMASQLSGCLAPRTIGNCRTAMRHYVAMVQALGFWPGTAIEASARA